MIQLGHVIGAKYRLVRLLGDGGMGSVYEAVHERLGTKVAVKILHPDIARRPGITERFLQEAKVAAQIKSPHIVSVSDVDTTPDGLAYMVMELLEGEPLSSLLEREKKLPVPVACAYTIQILEALEAAHAMGVVHRDLKPDNVFVTFVGQKPVLKLIDFGIAKVRRDDQRNLTMAGVTMGTAEYMAPEQAYSADKADARADIYSVGVMLYEMLSGTRPALGETARAVAAKVERGEITPLVHVAPEVPQRIAGACHRAMAPRPEMRFLTATEMRLVLEEALSDKSTGVPAAAPKGSTLMTAPVQAVFAAPPGAPHAPAQAPPPAFESTQRTPPLDVSAAPPAYVPPPAPYTSDRPARRRRGSGMWLVLVGGALLLGASVVVVLVVIQKSNDDTTIGTPTTTTTTVASAQVDAGSTPISTNDPLPALRPGTVTPPPVTAPSTSVRPTTSDGGAPSVTIDASTIPPFPSFNLPPFPFPEGGVFQLPSGLPPLFPPPPTQ